MVLRFIRMPFGFHPEYVFSFIGIPNRPRLVAQRLSILRPDVLKDPERSAV